MTDPARDPALGPLVPGLPATLPNAAPTSLLNVRTVHDAIQQTLATLDPPVPAHHGVAAIVDLNGEKVGVATRLGKGWNLELDEGYNWGEKDHGFLAQVQVGKTWP